MEDLLIVAGLIVVGPLDGWIVVSRYVMPLLGILS